MSFSIQMNRTKNQYTFRFKSSKMQRSVPCVPLFPFLFAQSSSKNTQKAWRTADEKKGDGKATLDCSLHTAQSITIRLAILILLL